MKKLLTISAIAFVLASLILSFSNNHLPKKVTIPSITYNDLEIQTAPGLYNWFDKDLGGNSNIGLAPEEGVNDIQPVIIEPNGKIFFSFDISIKPKDISLNLWRNEEIVSKKIFEETREGFFNVPSESGIYVYEIYAEWDETHTSAFSFKVEVL